MTMIEVKGKKIELLGDPHLGRRFMGDVPLHRRGEHEKLVNDTFRNHFLGLPKCAVHICMGDLFDRPIVPPEIIALAADAYAEATRLHPRTRFVLLAGNHDISRDLSAVNSFDILRRIIEPMGVMVVQGKGVMLDDLGLCPWVPDRSSAEIASELPECNVVFGHWDVVSPRSDWNIVPRNLPGNPRLVTGHDHLAREEGNLLVVGSMLPYAHGEDRGEVYRTVTLTELAEIEDTRMLCLRIVLGEGERLPDGIDALQVKSIRRGEELLPDIQVGFDGLDMASLFAEVMTGAGVGEALKGTLYERYRTR